MQRLPFEMVSNILLELLSQKPVTVLFSGGEPTLDPYLPEYLDLAVQKLGYTVGVVTNGVDFSDRLLDSIIANQSLVQVSLDTVDPEIYKDLCGLPQCDAVLRNISRLMEAGIEPVLSFTVTTLNARELPKIINFCLSQGITHLHVGNLVSSGRASCYKELDGISWMDLWNILYPIQVKYYEHIAIDFVEDFLLPIAMDTHRNYYCNAMVGKGIEILSSGLVTACDMMPKEKYTYGNLHHSPFGDILHQLNHGKFGCPIDFSKLQECKTCNIQYICAGGCRAIAVAKTGDLYGRHPHCDDNRCIFEMVQNDLIKGKLDEYFSFIKQISSEQNVNSRYF